MESFHSHLVKFILGTSASAVNFQAYLLGGITRWNAAWAKEASMVPTGDRVGVIHMVYHKGTCIQN